jgi:hypothetical protein
MKKTVTVLMLFLAIFMYSPRGKFNMCSSSLNADTTFINPNGSSELADLMREMQQFSIEERNRVLESKKSLPSPESFNEIHKAKITDGMSKSENFTTFSNLYLSTVNQYAKSGKEDRVTKFNNMIAACLACHSENCPGPVPVIRKLQISTD